MKNHMCRSLFMTFFKIGLFTFGGGYAMIPLIKREVTEHHKWLTEEEMFDITVIAETTPGPLAINSATFIGSKLNGLKGALSATAGVVAPSFFIILAISHIVRQLEHIKLIQDAFFGIRIGVLVLIANACRSLFLRMEKTVFTLVLLGTALILRMCLKVDTIIILILCGICGIAHTLYHERRRKR